MNILEKIIEEKKREVNKLKKRYTPANFAGYELYNKKRRPVYDSIKAERLFLIAEVKKASPSKGIIAENFDPLKTAQEYINGGTDAISVLTDENFFMGNKKYLETVSLISDKPVLRKDFIIDPIQIYESKALGADFILLIDSILDKSQLLEYSLLSAELGMETLVEIHSPEDVEGIDFSLNPIIGINSRNLRTFSINLGTVFNIARILPDNVKVIAESGISSIQDIRKYYTSPDIDGALVGEYLMRSENKVNAVRQIKEQVIYED